MRSHFLVCQPRRGNSGQNNPSYISFSYSHTAEREQYTNCIYIYSMIFSWENRFAWTQHKYYRLITLGKCFCVCRLESLSLFRILRTIVSILDDKLNWSRLNIDWKGVNCVFGQIFQNVLECWSLVDRLVVNEIPPPPLWNVT